MSLLSSFIVGNRGDFRWEFKKYPEIKVLNNRQTLLRNSKFDKVEYYPCRARGLRLFTTHMGMNYRELIPQGHERVR